MGPMSIRVATYFPFNITCYCNGHSFVAQELTRAGVRFRKADNAFLGVADVAALQAAADRLSAAILQATVRVLGAAPGPRVQPGRACGGAAGVPLQHGPDGVSHGHRLQALCTTEGVLPTCLRTGRAGGGAERTTHLFGRRINRRYQGKLQTVLDQRDAGHPVLHWYYQTSFAKQYTRGDDHHADRILRNETCSNDTRHFGVGRRLENLPLLRDKLAATNERCLALQADLLASTVDAGQLAGLAKPTLVGHRRVPGLKLHDDRVIRVLETLLHPGAFATDWTTRELHTRILAHHRLADNDYRLSQLRYDLAKLRAKGLVERLGRTRRYRTAPSAASSLRGADTAPCAGCGLAEIRASNPEDPARRPR